jgi:hypothetical protein
MEKQQYFLAVIALLLLISSAAAIIATSDSIEYYCVEENVRHGYIWLPARVSDLFLGGKVNLHFSMPNGNRYDIYGTVQDQEISGLHCGASAEYDYDVSMGYMDALHLATSTKPVTTFVGLWRSGNIILEANGQENQEKLDNTGLLVSTDDEPVPEPIRSLFLPYLN